MRTADFLKEQVFFRKDELEIPIGTRAENGARYTNESEIANVKLKRDRMLYAGVLEGISSTPDFQQRAGISYEMLEYKADPALTGTALQDFLFSTRQLIPRSVSDPLHITPVSRRIVMQEQKSDIMAYVPFFPGHPHLYLKDPDESSRPHSFRHWGDVKSLYVTSRAVSDSLSNLMVSATMIEGVAYPQYTNSQQSHHRLELPGRSLSYIGSNNGASGIGSCSRCFGDTSFESLLDPEYLVAGNDDYNLFPWSTSSPMKIVYRRLVAPCASYGDSTPAIADSYMLKSLAHKFHRTLFDAPTWKPLGVDDYDWSLVRWHFGLFSGHVNFALTKRLMSRSLTPIFVTGDSCQYNLASHDLTQDIWKEPWAYDIETFGVRRYSPEYRMQYRDSGTRITPDELLDLRLERCLIYTATPLNSVFFVLDRTISRMDPAMIPVNVVHKEKIEEELKLVDRSGLNDLVPQYLRIRYVHQLLDRLRNVRFIRERHILRILKNSGVELPEHLSSLDDLDPDHLYDFVNWATLFSAREQEVLLAFFSELNYDDYRYGIDQVNRFAWSLLGSRGVAI